MHITLQLQLFAQRSFRTSHPATESHLVAMSTSAVRQRTHVIGQVFHVAPSHEAAPVVTGFGRRSGTRWAQGPCGRPTRGVPWRQNGDRAAFFRPILVYALLDPRVQNDAPDVVAVRSDEVFDEGRLAEPIVQAQARVVAPLVDLERHDELPEGFGGPRPRGDDEPRQWRRRDHGTERPCRTPPPGRRLDSSRLLGARSGRPPSHTKCSPSDSNPQWPAPPCLLLLLLLLLRGGSAGRRGGMGSTVPKSRARSTLPSSSLLMMGRCGSLMSVSLSCGITCHPSSQKVSRTRWKVAPIGADPELRRARRREASAATGLAGGGWAEPKSGPFTLPQHADGLEEAE